MEDPNNNDGYAFVPDFLTPDLLGTRDKFPPDEQSVPILDLGSPTERDQYAHPGAPGWMGNQADPRATHAHRSLNYTEGAPSRQSLLTYDPTWLAPCPCPEGALSTNHVVRPATRVLPPAPSVASPPPPSPPSPGLHCPVCFRTFKQKLSLTNHQRSHTDRQPHECTLCGETFKYKTNFKRHRRIHAKEMKICRYCGSNMESDYELVQHEKEHRRQQKQL